MVMVVVVLGAVVAVVVLVFLPHWPCLCSSQAAPEFGLEDSEVVRTSVECLEL
jgi:hypothetical protein